MIRFCIPHYPLFRFCVYPTHCCVSPLKNTSEMQSMPGIELLAEQSSFGNPDLDWMCNDLS